MRSLGFYKKNLTVVLIIFLAVTPIVRADNEENKVRIEYSIQSSPAYAGNIIEVSLWEVDFIGRRLSSTPSAKNVYEVTQDTYSWSNQTFSVRDRNSRYELMFFARGTLVEAYNVRIQNGRVEYSHRSSAWDWKSTPPRFNVYNITPPDQPPSQQLPQEDSFFYSSYWGQVRPDETITARLFAKLVETLVFNLWQFLGLHDPVVLFFNVHPEEIYDEYGPLYLTQREFSDEKLQRSLYVDPEDPDTFLYTFSKSEESIMGKIYGAFSEFLRIPYVVAVAAIGLSIIIGSIYARDLTYLKRTIGGILLFPAFLRFFPALLEPLFWLNYTIVRAVGSLAQEVTTPSGELVSPLSQPFVTILIGSGTNIGALGVLIGTALLLFLLALLNHQYFIRRMMLAVLIVMFPIVAFLQIFPGNRQTLQMWWSEFTSNLLLQSAHAIVYLLFISYVYQAQLPFLPVLAMMGTLATVTVFVRNLMGCRPGSGMVGMFGNVLGIGALVGAARVAGSIVNRAGTTVPAYTDPREEANGTVGTGGAGPGPVPTVGEGIAGGGSVEPATPVAEPAAGVSYSTEPLTFGTAETAGDGTAVGGAENAVGLAGEGPTAAPEDVSLPFASPGEEGDVGLPLTGPAYGATPKVPRSDGSLIKGVAKLGTVGAMSLGMLAGTAAFGPGGAGIGAMVGAKGAGVVMGVADYGYGITRNYMARNRFLEETKKVSGIESDVEAAIFAATGVRATKREILADPVMTQQYWNVVDTMGFSRERAYLDQIISGLTAGSEEYRHLKEVRELAQEARERYIVENPEATVQEINQMILDNIIRPEFLAHDGLIGEERS